MILLIKGIIGYGTHGSMYYKDNNTTSSTDDEYWEGYFNRENR